MAANPSPEERLSVDVNVQALHRSACSTTFLAIFAAALFLFCRVCAADITFPAIHVLDGDTIGVLQ